MNATDTPSPTWLALAAARDARDAAEARHWDAERNGATRSELAALAHEADVAEEARLDAAIAHRAACDAWRSAKANADALTGARLLVYKALLAAPLGLTVAEIRTALHMPATTAVAKNVRHVLADLASLGLAMKHRPLDEPDTWTAWTPR